MAHNTVAPGIVWLVSELRRAFEKINDLETENNRKDRKIKELEEQIHRMSQANESNKNLKVEILKPRNEKNTFVRKETEIQEEVVRSKNNNEEELEESGQETEQWVRNLAQAIEGIKVSKVDRN